MRHKISNELQCWADEIWEKLNKKYTATLKRLDKNLIPYTSKDGKFLARSENIEEWTNGFWGGLMWLMYLGTKDENYKKCALHNEVLLDKALESFEKLHHDVGFMWLLTSGVNYKLTNNEQSKERMIKAATFLASRFNVDGGYIRAWNGTSQRMRQIAIIDCMMNIPILYWISKELQDDRFKTIAMRHADKVMKMHVREDGSVKHIVQYDEHTGEIVCVEGGQGYNENSSWSRGQAWGLYGFTLSYIHTGKNEYLDTAKKIANYFIAASCSDWLVRSDFRAPDEPVLYDSTAAMIATCGLLELSEQVGEYEGKMYFNAAINLLKETECNFADWSEDTDGVIDFGSEMYHGGQHQKIIYGDYYFAEAISKLRNTSHLFW